ncbi:hypothetical protein Tco_1482716 [Tanacetum coccineum]
MADKYEYEKRKKEKLEEVKARLDFGDNRKKSTRAQESAIFGPGNIAAEDRVALVRPRHIHASFTRLRWKRTESTSAHSDASGKLKIRKSVRWAMPHGFCHMFLIPRARKRRCGLTILPPESIDSYNDFKRVIPDKIPPTVKKMHQRIPIVLHYIKQRDGGFHRRLHTKVNKSEVGNVKVHQSAENLLVCARNQNPELIKRFHEKIPKIVDEMMQVATSFLQGQEAASNQERKKVPQAWRHPEGNHRQNFKKGGGFRSQHKAEKRPDRFSGEIKWPLGQITLLVKVGDDEHSTSAWMDFMVVRSTSPFNGIIERPGLRKMKAVPSTTHKMMKFPVMGVAINPEHPKQTVMIGSDLTEKTRSKLCDLLQRSLDIFAWTPTDMTGVPRQDKEQKLNVGRVSNPV